MNKLIRTIVQGWLTAGEDIIVGGQAVIEGVMMRSPNAYAVAVRKKTGEIVYKGEQVPRMTDKYPILKLPILRGAATLLYSMALGIKTLNFSATTAFDDAVEDSTDEKPKELKPKESKNDKAAAATATGSIIFALIFNILIFVVLPLMVTNAIFLYLGGGLIHVATSANSHWYSNLWLWFRAYVKPVRPTVAFNLVDGFIRMGLFLTMIYAFSRLKDIHRVFQYHGVSTRSFSTTKQTSP